MEEFSLTSDEIPLVIKELLQDNDDSDVIKIRDDNDIYSVTYEKENGEKFSKVFMDPIKYIDSTGKAQYIDTSIVKKENISDGYEYRNASNEFLSEFSTDPSIGIRLTKDANPISMAAWNDGIEIKSDELLPDDTGLNLTDSNSVTLKSTEDQTKLLNDINNDEFIYHGAFGENTIVKYTSTTRGIKEDIILEKKPGYNTFSFSLNTGDLIPVLIEDGQAIAIIAPNEESDYEDITPESMLYYLSSIYVYDSYHLPEGVWVGIL